MVNKIRSLEEFQKLPKNIKDYYFQNEIDSADLLGWKIHCFLNSEDNVIQSLQSTGMNYFAEYLIKSNLEHKYGNGSDGSRTFTIYCQGDRDDVEKIATDIQTKFGKVFQRLSPEGFTIDNDKTDYMYSLNVGMRFDGLKTKGYGMRGVPFLYKGRIQNGIFIGPHIAAAISKKNTTPEQERAIQLLTSHIVLAKHCGTKYLGKNYTNTEKDWDRFLFDPKFNDTSQFSNEEIKKMVSMVDYAYSSLILDAVKSEKSISIDINQRRNQKRFLTQEEYLGK